MTKAIGSGIGRILEADKQIGGTFSTEHNNAFAGHPPSHLNDLARKEWLRIAPMLEARGLIVEEESVILALYCQSYGRWQEAEAIMAKLGRNGQGLIVTSPTGYPIQNPYLSIANAAMEQCYKYLQQFGLSPGSRTKVLPKAIEMNKPKKSKATGYFDH